MTLTLPVASFDPHHYKQGEPGIQGLVDLVRWEVWKWDEDGQSSRHPLPRSYTDFGELNFIPPAHPIIPHLLPARAELLENLSMFSEELMELLLSLPSNPASYLGVESSVVMRHLRKATLQNEILPVLCGSAVKHIGTDLLMDYIGDLLANPLDVGHIPYPRTAPLRLLAWKVGWDKRKGWMTFVRVYSGSCLPR
jgi:Translation elongation factors (GTPases)